MQILFEVNRNYMLGSAPQGIKKMKTSLSLTVENTITTLAVLLKMFSLFVVYFEIMTQTVKKEISLPATIQHEI